MTVINGQQAARTEYDLHGIVGVRILDATPADEAVVARQLGPIQGSLTRDPDITIRFVDRLSTSSTVRFLGVDDTGFTDQSFLVLRSKHKARTRVQIPFDQIGQLCEIECERGLPAVPLLIPILNFAALSKGALPMHASAFRYNGTGALVTGWAKGGKTETLLAFMSNGAKYVGDEWIYISDDGQQMYGIPEPIRIWNWHLQEMPHYRMYVGRGERARLRGLNAIVRSMEWAISSGVGRGSATMRLTGRISSLLKRQMHVQLPPDKLFGQGESSLTSNLDKVFFVASHEAPDITVQPIDPQEIAQRMVFSLQEERMDFMSYYLKFRFAFPLKRNMLIEQAEELQRQLLLQVMAGKECYAIYHPYPVSIPALFDVINPLVG
ncbi:MAG: hypothetical protein WA996_05920 [Candidatus Promineifilaceae bacterium]